MLGTTLRLELATLSLLEAYTKSQILCLLPYRFPNCKFPNLKHCEHPPPSTIVGKNRTGWGPYPMGCGNQPSLHASSSPPETNTLLGPHCQRMFPHSLLAAVNGPRGCVPYTYKCICIFIYLYLYLYIHTWIATFNGGPTWRRFNIHNAD